MSKLYANQGGAFNPAWVTAVCCLDHLADSGDVNLL
jgi:hypothetical protein